MTDAVIRFRIDEKTKNKAIHLFEKMGLTMSEAARLFIYQSVAEQRLPFSINIPNKTTREAIKQAEHEEELHETSLEQLKKDWKAACDE